MPDTDAREFAAAAAAARAAEEELERLRAENAELTTTVALWAWKAGLARGALYRIVGLIPEGVPQRQEAKRIADELDQQLGEGGTGG